MNRLAGCIDDRGAVIVVNPRVADLEAALAAGQITCPGCGGPLRPWGYARSREVRGRGGSARSWRPRRAWCASCSVTHVLLPSSLLPRRRDEAQVIGTALLGHAGGQGHRRIAAQLDRPAATVRGWLRRFARNAERLRVTAAMWLHRLDPMADVSSPCHSATADTLEALARAAGALRLRLGGGPGGVWDDINSLVGASLLAPARR